MLKAICKNSLHSIKVLGIIKFVRETLKGVEWINFAVVAELAYALD